MQTFQRIEVKCTRLQFQLLARTAERSGVPLEEFVLAAAVEHAYQVIDDLAVRPSPAR